MAGSCVYPERCKTGAGAGGGFRICNSLARYVLKPAHSTMALSLATTPFANLPDSPPSESSQVRLARPEQPLRDGLEDAFEQEGVATTPGELVDPPLDFAEFIGERWGLQANAARELLSDWLRCYEPRGDYSAALGGAAT